MTTGRPFPTIAPLATLGLLLTMGFIAALSTAQGDDAPSQVHVTLSDEEIAVQWARPGNDTTRWNDEAAWSVDSGTVQSTVPHRVKVIEPGIVMHTARVPRAEGNGSVTYRVGSQADGWSPWRTISAAPDDAGVWRFLLVGDMGAPSKLTAEVRDRVVPMLLEEDPVAVLHAGDLSYANGEPAVWDEWFEMIEPLASTTFYQAAPGNHEHEADRLQGAMVADPHPYRMFVERLEYPEPELHYSFDVGPVHVLVFNTEDICSTPPEGLGDPWSRGPSCQPSDANESLVAFVEQDLAEHADAPWTVVLIHRPVYSAGAHDGHPVLQERFAPLFEEHGVDLVVAGHDHNYQRSFPLRDGAVVDENASAYTVGNGTIYLVTGGAGRVLYDVDAHRPAWSAAHAVRHHYVRLDVTVDGLEAAAVSIPDGAVLDSFTVGRAPDETDATSPGPEDPSRPMSAVPFTVAVIGLAVAAWSANHRKDK